MNDYYVYLHSTADTKEVFYVGKGRGDRAQARYVGRTAAWKRVVAEHGLEVRYVAVGLDNFSALVRECMEIAHQLELGANLVNTANLITKRDVRHKGREHNGDLYYAWRNVGVPMMVCKTVSQMVVEQGSCPIELGQVLSGELAVTSDGWITNEDR